MNERRPIPDIDDGRTHLELYVRSLSPAGARSRQDAVIGRLAALVERDVIAAYAVHVWGTGIRPASATARTTSGRFAAERLGAFEDWAAHNGLTLGDAFRTTEVRSTLTGTSYTERSFPVLTLAERVGPDLRRVTPCRAGATTYSVADLLDAIEDGRPLLGSEPLRPLPAGRGRQRPVDPGIDRNTDRSVENGANSFAIPGFVE